MTDLSVSGTPRYRFAIVGAGWRTTFYLRVASAASDRFHLSGVVARSRERAEEVTRAWGVEAHPGLESLLQGGRRPDFVVLSVPRSATVRWLEELTAAGLPVLCETPPGVDLPELLRVTELAARGPRVQVAEQYQYQPLHAARLALTDGGVIGTTSMVSLSVAHDYHGFSLMRRHLQMTGEPAVLRASTLRSTIESGFGTSGPRRTPGTTEEIRTVGLVDFGSSFGLYDFAGEQYFSYIRSPHVSIRGSIGEISDRTVRRLLTLDEPISEELRREETGLEGDLGGRSLRGISFGDRWSYKNPFPGARLSDDEIAIATCLELMGRYAEGGPAFYGLADAAQDHYLSLCLHQAATTGDAVHAVTQPWAGALLDASAVGGILPSPVLEDHGTSRRTV
ncbi:MAG: putative dehydrogenase [Acidimicrobiaceae bacterium]|nr:putative dehydrogenase [Acidimicrobiaceae bacterium]